MIVTKKEIKKALSVNLIDFLQNRYSGEIVYDKKKTRWCRNDHDSCEVKQNGFKWWSHPDIYGDAIQYMMQWHYSHKDNKAFQKAVMELNTFENREGAAVQKIRTNKRTQKFRVPTESDKTWNYVFSYLTKDRGIDESLIKLLHEQKLVYSDYNRNVVFVNEKRSFVILRGTSKTKPFKGCLCDEKNEYWMINPFNSEIKKIYICEAPIDAMSLLCLRNKINENAAFAAMGGLKPDTIKKIEEDYPGVEIEIATDWDAQGQLFYDKNYKDKYKRLKPSSKFDAAIVKKWKDWNGMLLAKESNKKQS